MQEQSKDTCGPGQPPEKPIRELDLDNFDENYFDRAQSWLMRLGCTFERVEGRPGVYHLTFPPNTVEQVVLGQSSLWSYVTRIVFTNGTSIHKYKVEPLPFGTPVTGIGLPRFVIEGSGSSTP
jgi:hypothetical protein